VAGADLIVDEAGALDALAAARAEGRAAVDLEFMWERTYAPQACLAQVAVGDRVLLVDPLAGAPLEPIGQIVADEGIEVVMHAPSADLTLLGLALDVRPRSLVDVQLVAGFVGLGAGQGLATLLDRVLGVRLDKAERYTDWAKRPLRDEQLEYAAADVAHLFALADELADRAAGRGRTEWVREEHERRYGEVASLVPDPVTSWRRIKGQGRLNPRERAVLAELAAWREQAARERDRPASWIVPDRTLIEIARRQPGERATLGKERGLPDRMRDADLDAMLAAMERGRERAAMPLPAGPPAKIAARVDALTPLAATVVATRAVAAGMASTLIATRDEIASHLAGVLGATTSASPLASGWRYELAGRAVEDLAHGRLALAASVQPPYVREITPP
jgi:ribonuclease D